MKTIGLVTFYSKNYGSILQCYATKRIIEKNGFRCEVLFQNEYCRSRIIPRVRKLFRVLVYSLIYPSFFKKFLLIKKSSKNSKESISSNTVLKMDEFVRINIAPRGVPYKQMAKEAHSEKYKTFIVGSDQVWSGVIPYRPFSFLMFAPREKRVAYAPSFGTNEIERYNRKNFKRAISSFRKLSIREKRGVEIVKELCGRTAIQLPDPTIMLTNEEWDDVTKNCCPPKNYILLHFLDEPNESALATINLLRKSGCSLLCIGYPRDVFAQFETEFVDADPAEYIAYIANASYVCTDSFHTTLFAIRNRRQFYVFPRRYKYGFCQVSRIMSILDDYGYKERFIEGIPANVDLLPKHLHDCEAVFLKQRQLAFDYLDEIFQENVSPQSNIPHLKGEYDCVGCGACEEVCPKHAIEMQYNKNGFCMPQVDTSICVKCGLCEKVCFAKIELRESNHRSYIAYSQNQDIRNRAASGGIFGAIASDIIQHDGVAVGAQFVERNSGVVVEHRIARQLQELAPLLKSKYVQSECWHVFKSVKSLLQEGKIVLYSGTSCQVDALYRYLGREYDNLFTMDLICHGVPGAKLFSDYIKFLESKHKSKIIDFTFRQKEGSNIQYVEKAVYLNGDIECIPWKKSLYYDQFLRLESYRDSCYQCKYATIKKPADITIGDYFEVQNDYPEICKENDLNQINGLSCIIVHTEKGRKLLEQYGESIKLIEVSTRRVQLSHNQLCFPTSPSMFRDKFFSMYQKGGYKAVSRYYKRRCTMLYIPKKIYHIVKSIARKKGHV